MRFPPAAAVSAFLSVLVLGCSSAVNSRSAAGPSGKEPVLLVGAGDIAMCDSDGDEATARLLDSLPTATIFTAGDNAYGEGTAKEFQECYGSSWGRHKARTRPSPGNHDYYTLNGAAYYEYFGANAGDPTKGYYSYDLGDWHIIALNSNVPMAAGSPQEQWLRADLKASGRRCSLAYWHHARFSSASHGNDPETQALWQALYDGGAEVVVVGHDHSYERFAPQDGAGKADSVRGVREFVVGTGGATRYSLGTRQPNSEAFDVSSPGIVKFTLEANGYRWEFVPTSGTFRDSGVGSCHA